MKLLQRSWVLPEQKHSTSVIQSDPDPIQTPETNSDHSIRIEQVVEPRKLRIFIVYYSLYGHVESLARNIKTRVEEIDEVEGVLFRVPETLSFETLTTMKVPVKGDDVPEILPEELVEADGLLFGFPTRWVVAGSDERGGWWWPTGGDRRR
ncbi:putative NAD(P)H dehydrogenase (quinone) [Helianthus anomalus]